MSDNKIIRVLQVVTQMNDGGLEHRLMDIYRRIDRKKIQLDFYTNRLEYGKYDEEIVQSGGKVYYSTPINVLRVWEKIKEFYNFLIKHPEYKIIHSHVNEWSTLFCHAAMQAGIPIRIAHSRASEDSTWKKYYKNILKIPLKKYATHYFAVSKEAGIHLFGKCAVRRGLVQVWPNAIECSKFSFSATIREKMKKYYNINRDTLVVMHVGRFSYVKNHKYLINVFLALNKLNPNSCMFLVGDGPEMENIKLLAKKLKIEQKIFFLGECNNINELLQMADVFVFPSIHEGFPGAVLEAETAGLTCFISDTISKEVVLTDKVIQLSIKLPPDEWAKRIVKVQTNRNFDCVNDIICAGYDIVSLTERISKFYENSYINYEGNY